MKIVKIKKFNGVTKTTRFQEMCVIFLIKFDAREKMSVTILSRDIIERITI